MNQLTILKAARDQQTANFKEPNYETTFNTFGDLLWQILILGRYENQVVAFSINVSGEGNELVLADEAGGFWKTGVFFAKNVYNDCVEICRQLNTTVLDLDAEEVTQIILKSVR